MSGYDRHQGFDWSDREAVVVPEQAATAVYTNNNGDIVIRQKGDPYEDEDDHWFILAPQNAHRLAHAILELVAYCDGLATAEQLYGEPRPNPNSNAERQRRHREKKRNGVTPTVTDPVTQEVPQLLLAAE